MINEKKLCFIWNSDKDVFLNESIKSVDLLEVPEGYEVQELIVDGNSTASGYNEAMEKTDAKYKIYLSRGSFIRNKRFIYDILNIFKNHDIGMIGVVGSITVPTNGSWYGSSDRVGKVLVNSGIDIFGEKYGDFDSSYKEVKIIDGSVMATQYDVKWREDIFKGKFFYDSAECIEFSKRGYKIVVARQTEAWCLITPENSDFKEFNEERKKFLGEYSHEIFPLVSILIPAFNRPKYFKIALESAINQTYGNIEILIGDDSTNDSVRNVVKPYLKKYKNIKYYKNEHNIGQFDNDLKLIEESSGEYINFLMDDDIFHPEKIRKMMDYYIIDLNKEITLVTSHRRFIDGDGNLLKETGVTQKLFDKDIIVDGIKFGNFILKTTLNFIGEPTTVLFRKKNLIEKFGVFNGRKYGCSIDKATWFNLLSQGKIVFIAQTLSYFRLHSGQQQKSDKMKLSGMIDYAHDVVTCRQKGFLKDNKEYSDAVDICIKFIESRCPESWYSNVEVKAYLNKLKMIRNQLLNQSKPLVSILIPAYNQTKYLKYALESAINQTYPNIEIIIRDDSSNDDVKNFIKPYLEKYKNVTYIKSEDHKMDFGISNITELLKLSNGEYVNFLFHDDIFAKDKIEKMMYYFLNVKGISLVTSRRHLIDENGKNLPDDLSTQRLFNKDVIINGREMCKLCLENLINYIGEATTVLFKKSLLTDRFGNFNKNEYLCNTDMSTWFSLLLNNNMVYISDTLSYFRRYDSQNTNNVEMHMRGILDWKTIIDDSYEIRLIEDKNEYIKMLSKWMETFFPSVIEKIFKNVEEETLYKLKKSFNDVIDKLFISLKN